MKLVYAHDGYYHLFLRDRGYYLKTGDYTPDVNEEEARRLLASGFFAATQEGWKKIEKGKVIDATNYLAGQRCFILAGGPSVKKINLEKLKNEFVIAVNHSIEFYPQAQAFLFIDISMYEHAKNLIDNYKGLIFASFRNVDRMKKRENLFFFPQNTQRPGKTIAEGLYSSKLSGLAAINLALIMGASKIYLLGYDMGYIGGEHHWYGQIDERQAKYSEENYHRKITAFDAFLPYKDIIFNCSRNSRLTQFQKVDFEEIIEPKNLANKQIPANNIASKYKTYPMSSMMKMSRVNNMFEGKRIFIIGSGPSLKGFDFNVLKDEITIAVNHTLEYYHDAKIHLFGDPRIFQYTKHIYDSGYKGLVFASFHADIGDYAEKENFYVFAKNWNRVTTRIEDGLYSNFNSGMEAVNLALIMGAKEIYLLGIDFCADNNEYYFYGKPKWFTSNMAHANDLLKQRAQYWGKYSAYKDKIYNCSKISMVKTFEYRDIKNVLGIVD